MATILILDDDPAHLKIYSWVVERGGFACLPVLVKPNELALPTTNEIDVAVLDYRLGVGLSAVDVAKQLREIYPGTPILVLSDLYGMPEEMAPFASGFVRKGEPQQLLDTIVSTLKAA